MPIKTNEREYRNFVLSIVEVAEGGEGGMIVRGYASTFNQPYVLYEDDGLIIEETVDPGAFEEADMSDVIMQYDHEGRVFARLSNDTLRLSVDEHGLAIEADLGGTQIGRQLYEEIKGGYTNKMSYAYTVTDDGTVWTREKLPDGRLHEMRSVTHIKKVYDVSAVSLPANDATSISVRKLTDGVIAELEAERLRAEQEQRKRLLVKAKSI